MEVLEFAAAGETRYLDVRIRLVFDPRMPRQELLLHKRDDIGTFRDDRDVWIIVLRDARFDRLFDGIDDVYPCVCV